MIDGPEFNFRNDPESDDFVASITHQLFTQIVKEEDEYTMNIIEEYVKNEKAKGKCLAARIIPEGRLRHIINLGLMEYNRNQKDHIVPEDLFPQEQYIEFLRRQLTQEQQENQRLRNQITIMEQTYGKEESE